MSLETLNALFHVDVLSWIMMGLVGFIGISIAAFARRYLKGDRQYNHFFVYLTLMIASLFIMVNANNVILFLAVWGVSNAFLVRLMIYKSNWAAAKNAGILAAKTFAFGFVCLSAGVITLAYTSSLYTIQELLKTSHDPLILGASLSLIFIGAMTQSALWPFHKWLISSLNSPTPVSAIMHAGLVNGGGFLLARFAPLYLAVPDILTLVFIAGIVTALVGTLWKLMQSDIKRMLACSTMGQMGFMVAQCGMGLFPAAIAHLCWHGLFKAYLFLASGSAAQEKRLDLQYPPNLKVFALALICGIGGAYSFIEMSGKSIVAGDTSLILITIAFIAGTQFSITLIRQNMAKMLPIAIIGTALLGALYGLSVHSMGELLSPLNIAEPQALNVFHVMAIGLLVTGWLGILFYRRSENLQDYPDWIMKMYVRMLNASQPHQKTITAHRNNYQY